MNEFVAELVFWISVLFDIGAGLGCGYALLAAWTARRFVRAPTVTASSYPAVTILKPLHGAEAGLYENLAGLCTQDYPSPVQIVCGVNAPTDPAIAVVRRLIAEFPGRDIALVIDGRQHGENHKISNLINMLGAARHEVLVLADSDIRVAPDYLQTIGANIERAGVGLVTLLYHGEAAAGLWSRLAAAWIDYHFLPNVLVGLKFGLATPTFGSTIALRRSTLASIGGFEAVADQLADDYVLGALVRQAGLTVAIPHYAVTHVCADKAAGDLLHHELRWARTIRSIDPLGFAGLSITQALPLALIAALLAGFTPVSVLILAAAIICRLVLQSEVDRAFSLRGGQFWLGPLRDLLWFVVFVWSFFGRGVEWRGHRFGVRPDSTLVPCGEVEP